MITRHLVFLSLMIFLIGCQRESRNSVSGSTQPFRGKWHEIPGTIEAENYDEGDPGFAYYDLDPQNQGANYRGPTQVDIEARPDASGGHGIGWTREGEWLVYSVEVAADGVYRVEFPVASNRKGGVFHLEIDGRDVTGPIDVPDTGGWQKLETIYADGVRLKAGRQLLKVSMDSNGDSGSIADIDLMRFTKVE